MNYCTKCSSYYQTPGTCNCFAGTAPRAYPINPQPWQPTWVPWNPNPYPYITITNNDATVPWTYTFTANANACQPITSGYSVVNVT